jgi:hypothetical protein
MRGFAGRLPNGDSLDGRAGSQCAGGSASTRGDLIGEPHRAAGHFVVRWRKVFKTAAFDSSATSPHEETDTWLTQTPP